MAYMKCSGGGEMKPEQLWENPSKGSNFTAQTITLSQDINNYDYIGIKAVKTKGDDQSTGITTMWKVTDFKKTKHDKGYFQFSFVGEQLSSGGQYYRYATYVSDTSMYISKCDRWANNNGANQRDQGQIPYFVYGFK